MTYAPNLNVPVQVSKGEYVICISVIPSLYGGLAKNNKIMPMFVLFSSAFGHFESLAFLKTGDKPYT